ncbi:MAG: putative F420-dependent oxidoreductase, family [Frankiales bacterium]|nr:putative F420-dependent oxidoreductase, family [Frankiales bacterium]
MTTLAPTWTGPQLRGMTPSGSLIPELGVSLIPGRTPDPAGVLDEVVAAEQLGLSCVWIAERFDTKELAVLCGAMAARTKEIRMGFGSLAVGSRNPVYSAATAMTFQSLFGDRLMLGLARGLAAVLVDQGMTVPTMKGYEDYVDILHTLFAGEEVSYDGPLGRFPKARLVDRPDQPRPMMWNSSWVPGPKALALTARKFDGLFLGTELTVEATRTIVNRAKDECLKIGRDPDTLFIANWCVTAPDLSPEEEVRVLNARMVTHLSFPGIGDRLVEENGWDRREMDAMLSRGDMGKDGVIADQAFTREQLVEAGRALPREWVETGCVVGTSEHCAKRVREYVDAGVDHVVVYGPSVAQLAPLVGHWRA